MNFYLGTHEARWLTDSTVALFVSHRRLAHRRTLPRAATNWALDSGAFSDIAQHGTFTTTPAGYVRAVRRYGDEIGRLDWAAPQDHMCEPWILAKSQLASTVAEAQRWTIANYLELRTLDATLPIIPVLQGQTLDDYRRHVDGYSAAAVDLSTQPVVGLGSVCRRQATAEIGQLVADLSTDLALHGFGVKSDGLRRYGWALTSADSMAWSYRGRRIRPCPHRGVTSCSNCRPHALEWRHRALAAEGSTPIVMTLWEAS